MNGSAAPDAPAAAPEDHRATDPQRVALLRWHVDPERARDPGLTRSRASKWLGTSTATKECENGVGPDLRKQPTPR